MIPFWYKEPDKMLQHQVSYVLVEDDLVDVKRVDFTVGGDHGGGKMRFVLKMLLRYNSKKESKNVLFQIVEIDSNMDKTDIIKNTVGTVLGDSLKRMTSGGHFIVAKDTQQNKLTLQYEQSIDEFTKEDCVILCNTKLRIFGVGDLKFFFQMLGRENMSSSWCFYCNLSPSQWKHERSNRGNILHEENFIMQEWTIELLREHYVRIEHLNLKQPLDIRGVKDFPLWDFIEVRDWMFPVLHWEIGSANLVLSSGVLDFVDDKVEVLSEEEKTARNNFVIADIASDSAKVANQDFLGHGAITLAFFRIELKNMNKLLKRSNISEEERLALINDKERLETEIKQLTDERKRLHGLSGIAKVQFSEARNALVDVRSK